MTPWAPLERGIAARLLLLLTIGAGCLLLAGCAIGMIRTPDNVLVIGTAFGKSEVSYCPRDIGTQTPQPTPAAGTPTATVAPDVSADVSRCAKIGGGNLSMTAGEVLGALISAGFAFLTKYLVGA